MLDKSTKWKNIKKYTNFKENCVKFWKYLIISWWLLQPCFVLAPVAQNLTEFWAADLSRWQFPNVSANFEREKLKLHTHYVLPPSSGIIFITEYKSVYGVFFTVEWATKVEKWRLSIRKALFGRTDSGQLRKDLT